MAKKGLGSGLGALFGDELLSSDALECTFLPISKVESSILQPRERFDEESLQALADSVSQHGILQPITVRRLSSGYFQIIAGERRWRAARIAGLSEIPARVIEADDRSAMELALVENLQREDLNPVEEAKGYKALIEDYGFTQEMAAKRVGKSRPSITNALRLLSLPDKVLSMLETGALSSGHARALLSLDNKDLICALADTVVRQDLSVRQTELLVKKNLSSSSANPKPADVTSIYVAELEERLISSLGRKVHISHGPKKGKIEIEYYGNEDLDRLIQALSSLDAEQKDKSEGGYEL
jgi:ParB family chromosome partitioning protein